MYIGDIMKLHGYIYKHTNKINNKVYIGQTIQVANVERRFRHKDTTYHSYKSCPAFFNALNKYTWDNFTTELIYSAFDQEALNNAEEYFINFYNSVAPYGYNASTVTNGSIVFTDEIKKKMSDARKEYYSNLDTPIIACNRKSHIIIDNIEHKECSKCKEVKVLNDFNKYSTRWDGLHTYCKVCHTKYRKPAPKLNEEDFKATYINRQSAVSSGVKDAYKNRPELRIDQTKRKSKPIIAIHIETGVELNFDSAKDAKQFGFDNTNVGVAIKNNKPYKKHMWRFK